MYRFYWGSKHQTDGWEAISIHPMYRFYPFCFSRISANLSFQYILCIGFTLPNYLNWEVEKIFQYILCIGFTKFYYKGTEFLKQFQYILCIGFTLIAMGALKSGIPFQYILCIGFTPENSWRNRHRYVISIHPMYRFYFCFNTSILFCISISIHPMYRFYLQ